MTYGKNTYNKKNMTQYCRENNLNSVMMSRVARGLAKNHKGYTKA